MYSVSEAAKLLGVGYKRLWNALELRRITPTMERQRQSYKLRFFDDAALAKAKTYFQKEGRCKR